MSYECVMCHKAMDGEPALKNGAGTFCPPCREVIRVRLAEAMEHRRQARLAPDGRPTCTWCGRAIKDGQAGVCQPCDSHRDWVLKTVRRTDRLARYVARIEEKEAPERSAREMARRRAEEQKPLPLAAPDPVAQRLERVEAMLAKMLEAWS
jgi:DNA-directed RNA polymerase subunit RPC12/RpoP